MKNPLTASERRGILTVAAIALIITGAGWLMSTCHSSSTPPSPPEIETLVNGDSASTNGASKKNTKSSNASNSKSSSKTKSTKTYRRRSPRDEEV